MARTETAKSLELERSMNMQVRVMTFEEHLSHLKMIDKIDDERRREHHGTLVWQNSMQRNFFKRVKESIGDINDPITRDNFSILKDILRIIDEWMEFQNDFQNKVKLNRQQEEIYEKHEDDTREFLIIYAQQCREKLSIENRNIEEKLILENVLKLMSKK